MYLFNSIFNLQIIESFIEITFMIKIMSTLSDCNGLACHLGGTLNLKTCKCKCPKLKYIENDESGQCVGKLLFFINIKI